VSLALKSLFRPIIARIKVWVVGSFPGVAGFYFRYFWKPRNQIEEEINKRSKRVPSFTFLQIGANDGRINDPIFPFIFRDKWRGHRFEPLEVPFGQLQKLHKRTPWVVPVNALLGTKAGAMPLYYLSFSTKRWATGLSSLNKSQLEAQIASGYVARRAQKYKDMLPVNREDWIASKKMLMYELNAWILQHSEGSLDLLQIDTEGYDHILLEALDLKNLRIGMICFEKLHIPKSAFLACVAKLEAADYRLVESECDVLALRG
jgi:hypothetical protein